MQMIMLDEGVSHPRTMMASPRAYAHRDIIKFRVLGHHYDHLPLGGGYIVAASFARETQK